MAAISFDPAGVLKSFADRKSIGFPLLSDENSVAIRAFGILNEKVPKTHEFYGIPDPVTFIVDEKGIVRSRIAEDDYRKRFTAGNILGRKTDVKSVAAKRLKITQSASDSVVHGGQRFKLRLEIQLPPRNHVYAPGVQGYIPIDWQLAANPAFEEIPMRYPDPRTLYLKAIKETVPVFEGRLVLERELIPAQKNAAGPLTIEGSLRYQVCDDKKCFVPETVPLSWTVTFEPHDPARAAPELRRKRR